MKESATLVPPERIDKSILFIRGEKVLLDADLAGMYGVEKKALTRAVRRNVERFPHDFMFQLSDEGFDDLRRHFGASSQWGGRVIIVSRRMRANLILHLTPETEAKLKQRANLVGKKPEDVALEALDERLKEEPVYAPTPSPDEWLREFDARVNSQKSRNPNFDDSRESIYPDRW